MKWLLTRVAYPLVVFASIGSAAGLVHLGLAPGLTAAAAFVVALLVTALLEHAHPLERAWLPSPRAMKQDALYLGLVSLSQMAARLLGQLLATLVARALVGVLGPGPWPRGAPLVAQCLLALLLADFAKYWLHRLAHERPWLWRFHAEHHSPRRMYSLNGVRLHPVNALWNLVLDAGIPLALRLDASEVLWIAVVRGAVSVLQHANVEMRLGPLDWIFSTPVLHRWHHSVKLEEANANYGSTFIVWDILFRTRHLPRGRRVPASLGLADGTSHPEGLWEQLALPWSSRRQRRP
ncbi:sterol desaturase family protein [soil metagenome]